jgi:membrane-associated phospholipid phosphatase
MRLPGRVRPTGGDRVLGPMLAEPRRALAWAGLLLGGALVLFLLVWSSSTHEVVQSVDDWFRHLVESLHWQPFVELAKVFDFLGGTYCNWLIRITVLAILAYRRQWLSLGAFALAIVVSEAMIGPMKALYDRPRPPGALVGTSGASFPSGHAVSSAVTAIGLVIVLLPPGHTRWVWERRAALFAALMAFSRTYLGAHWLSDVVAGALLGCGIAIACPALLVEIRVRVNARRERLQRE